MYVCICHAITESEVRTAVGAGARTVDHLRAQLSAATCCGACAVVLEDCLDRLAAAPQGAIAPSAAAS